MTQSSSGNMVFMCDTLGWRSEKRKIRTGTFNVKSRIVVGIGAGTFSGFILALLIVNLLPFYIAEYLPVVLGAFIANLIINRRTWWIGASVSIFIMALSELAFFFVTTPYINFSAYDLKITLKIILKYLLYLPSGILGGYLGCYVRNGRK